MRRRPPDPPSTSAWAAHWLARGAFVFAVIAAASARLGLLRPETALVLLGLSIVAGVAALVSSATALAHIWRTASAGTGMVIRAILFAGVTLALPLWFGLRAATLPVLNDVTTDLQNPPSFARTRAAIEARGGQTPAEFVAIRAPDIRAAYPDLAPVTLEMSPQEAYELSLRKAVELGWTVIDSTPPGGRLGTGRIDAVHRSMIFRFTDDITIRIRPFGDDAQIDLRSASRLGQHDFGVNAERIRQFAKALEMNAVGRR